MLNPQDRTHKLLILAFDPSATEGEAVNAFLAARKQASSAYALFKTEQSYNPNTFTRAWRLVLLAKNFDALLYALNKYRNDHHKAPLYVLEHTEDRRTIMEAHKLEFSVTFNTKERLEHFTAWFDQAWKIIAE